MSKTQYAALIAKHLRCVELAQLHAANLQGEDSKQKLWKSYQEAERKFQAALKQAR